jgi:hypothetical protein
MDLVFKDITISQFSLTWKLQPQSSYISSVFMQKHYKPTFFLWLFKEKTTLQCSLQIWRHVWKRPADTSECGHSLWWLSCLINHRFCCVDDVLGWCKFCWNQFFKTLRWKYALKVKWKSNIIDQMQLTNMIWNKLSICNWLMVDTPKRSISIFYMCTAIWYWPKIVAIWNSNTFW